jgi:hypothetical protein
MYVRLSVSVEDRQADFHTGHDVGFIVLCLDVYEQLKSNLYLDDAVTGMFDNVMD